MLFLILACLPIFKKGHPENMKYSSSTNCTKCNSTETKSFEMVYNSGTSSGTVSVGTYNPEDGFGISSGNISSQTLLAKKVQPPIKPEWTLVHIAAVILPSFIGFVAFTNFLGVIAGLVVGFGLGAMIVFAINKSISKLKPTFQHDYDKWLRSWLCLKCGTSWQFRPR